jgi:hypothetical protein
MSIPVSYLKENIVHYRRKPVMATKKQNLFRVSLYFRRKYLAWMKRVTLCWGWKRGGGGGGVQ